MQIHTVLFRQTLLVLFIALSAVSNPTETNAGNLNPPSSPSPTMRPLDELNPVWNKIIPAAQRFVDALDGSAVLDKETGLVWAKSPDSTPRSWQDAADYCTTLSLGTRMGWRLPTIEELASLVDQSVAGSPKLPAGHPFQNVSTNNYWSSASYSGNTGNAWNVNLNTGTVTNTDKTDLNLVWPVRFAK